MVFRKLKFESSIVRFLLKIKPYASSSQVSLEAGAKTGTHTDSYLGDDLESLRQKGS